jgi:hypothetical protein
MGVIVAEKLADAFARTPNAALANAAVLRPMKMTARNIRRSYQIHPVDAK